MYNNYSNRVKHFIIDMINPDTQITINNDTKSKEDILKKEINKDSFIQKKPFIFKGYSNEKERIIEHIKNNQYLNGIYDYNGIKNHKEKKENSKNKLMKNIIKRNRLNNISPYTKNNINNKYPSNDKSINSLTNNNISVIVNKLFPYKEKNKINLKSVFNSVNNNNNKTKEITNNKKELNAISQYISKNKKMNKRKIKNENHLLFNSYNNKLHFKAAEEVAENKTNKKNKYLLLLPNLFKNNKSKEKKDIFFHDEKKGNKTKEDEEDDDEEYYYNRFYYKNPFHELKKRTKYNPNLIKQLSEMAFEKDNSKKIFEIENKKDENINQTFDKGIKKLNIKDENEVEIDGEIFEKTTQFNLITKKVLQICKVYNKKARTKRNFPRAGDGKNMMTKGMSVNNFVKKYKLKYL